MIGYDNGVPVRIEHAQRLRVYRQFRMIGHDLRPMRFAQTSPADHAKRVPVDAYQPNDPGPLGGPSYRAHCVPSGLAHPAPQVDCHWRCGFYTYWSPDTDFYRGDTWDGPHVNMRGVVEVWGDTVWCVNGVRASYMRIIALAVNWEQRRSAVNVGNVGEMALRLGLRYGIDVWSTPRAMHTALPAPDIERYWSCSTS